MNAWAGAIVDLSERDLNPPLYLLQPTSNDHKPVLIHLSMSLAPPGCVMAGGVVLLTLLDNTYVIEVHSPSRSSYMLESTTG